MLRSIAAVGDADAKLALLTLGRLDRGALGRRACELAERLSGSVPSRLAEVGTARLVKAFYASSSGDGEVILFKAHCAGRLAHMLTLFIDEQHSAIAKHIALLRPFNPLRSAGPLAGAGAALKFRPADLAAMREKARHAITRTDAAARPPVGESFSNYRAIALARLDPLAN